MQMHKLFAWERVEGRGLKQQRNGGATFTQLSREVSPPLPVQHNKECMSQPQLLYSKVTLAQHMHRTPPRTRSVPSAELASSKVPEDCTR